MAVWAALQMLLNPLIESLLLLDRLLYIEEFKCEGYALLQCHVIGWLVNLTQSISQPKTRAGTSRTSTALRCSPFSQECSYRGAQGYRALPLNPLRYSIWYPINIAQILQDTREDRYKRATCILAHHRPARLEAQQTRQQGLAASKNGDNKLVTFCQEEPPIAVALGA